MAVVLVDTSIWIEVHHGRLDLEAFVKLEDVAICPPIAQELLQGANNADLRERVGDNPASTNAR